jgi:hypothetical protein
MPVGNHVGQKAIAGGRPNLQAKALQTMMITALQQMTGPGSQLLHGSRNAAARKAKATKKISGITSPTKTRREGGGTVLTSRSSSSNSRNETGAAMTAASTSEYSTLFFTCNTHCRHSWSRRDHESSPPRANRTPKKRRQRSPSRSRSRSPADSWYSRRSSRGRSRSRSTSPKRRRRDTSAVRPRSPSPDDRARIGWGPRRGREYSKSPASSLRSRDSRVARGRSFSSPSSSSRSRSRSSSRSPADHPRPKHRLPPATSVKDINLPISKTGLPRSSGMLPPRDTDSHRTGSQPNGKHVNVVVHSYCIL